MAPNPPRRSPGSLQPGSPLKAPLSRLPAPAHTGPDLRVSLLGPREQTRRVEVAGSGPTLTFTAASLPWSQRGSWSPAQPGLGC